MSAAHLFDLTIGLAAAWTLCSVSGDVRRICSSIYWRRRLGICWRYQPTGVRENRNGTISDFCQRCGHPGGYHFDR